MEFLELHYAGDAPCSANSTSRLSATASPTGR
jgi:hypothetical protein